MSCVVDMFMVWDKELKTVMVGGDNNIVRGEWWVLLSWVELCIICKIRMSSIRIELGV